MGDAVDDAVAERRMKGGVGKDAESEKRAKTSLGEDAERERSWKGRQVGHEHNRTVDEVGGRGRRAGRELEGQTGRP